MGICKYSLKFNFILSSIVLQFFLCLSIQNTWAQGSQTQVSKYYWILFDSNKVERDMQHVALNAKSIQRRQNQGLKISLNDYPIAAHWKDTLKELNINVIYFTRWFLGALVQSDSDLTQSKLSFLKKSLCLSPFRCTDSLRRATGIQSYAATRSSTNLEAFQEQSNQLCLDKMKEAGIEGEGIILAILDGGFTGVDQSSVYEKSQFLPSYDFVDHLPYPFWKSSHGSKVFSILGAQDRNGFEGILPKAKYFFARTENEAIESPLEELNWLFAAEMADSLGADVIASSLSYSTFDDTIWNYTQKQTTGKIAIISQAASLASSKGISCVVSAGNLNQTAWGTITFPADVRQVLSVGASTGNTPTRAGFSSQGPTGDGRIKPDVVAKGVNTWVMSPQNEWITDNGTSFATPIVAGLTAGLRSVFPKISVDSLHTLIRNSGTQASSPNNQIGYGWPCFSKVSGISALLTKKSVKEENFRLQPQVCHSCQEIIWSSSQTNPSFPFFASMFDVCGKLIWDGLFYPNLSYKLPELESGLYLWKLQTNTGLSHQTKFIKL